MANRNPWIGLASYDESKISSGYKFCGRSSAIQELFAKIDNNLFTTLYGKSGIGKTSLIQAGLFPKLRANGYFPVLLRLGIYDDSYVDVIIENIINTALASGIKCVKKVEGMDFYEENNLRTFLKTTEFRDSGGHTVFPTIVLDQFEELFYKNKNDLYDLMKQIYLLLDDSCISDIYGEEDITNYRLLVSLREDDLFYFEDAIDRLRFHEMKYNRHRLQEMTREEAEAVIYEPGSYFWETDGYNKIVDKILRVAKGEDGEMSTAILSLVCNQIFESATNQGLKSVSFQFVNSFLEATEGRLFLSYYQNVKKKLPASHHWYYIEDELVTDDGRRKSVLESEFSKHIQNASFLFEGEYSILRYVTIGTRNERQVEIIHDTLAKAIFTYRRERHLNESIIKQKRRNRITIGITSLILAVLCLLGSQYYLISKNRDNMLASQSRYLLGEAQKLIKDKEVNLAAKLLLYALPRNIAKPDRPYIEEVSTLLQSFNDTWCGYPVSAPMRHDNQINTADFSPDDKYVVTASNDGYARVWNAYTGKPVSPIIQHNAEVNSAKFSPDGKLIVTASDNCSARVWDAYSGEAISLPMLHNERVTSAQFSPDGKYVVTASDDGTACVWDAFSGKQISALMLHDEAFTTSVECAKFSPDGKYIATASFFYAKIWDAHTGNPITSPLIHDGDVFDVSFSPDGKYLVTAAADGIARIWNISSGELVVCTEKQDKMLHRAEFSHNGKLIITNAAGSIVQVWNAATGEKMSPQIEYTKEIGRGLVAFGHSAFSPDDKYIITGSFDGNINVWDTQTWESKVHISLNHTCQDIKFSHSGNLFITACGDGTAQVWNISEEIATISAMTHDEPIECAVYSPDGRTIATACYDSGIRFWNARTGELIKSIMIQKINPTNIAFTPYGNELLIASNDSTYIYNINTGIISPHLLIQGKHSWSDDGDKVATFTQNTVNISDSKTGQILLSLIHDHEVAMARISHDNKYIATITGPDDEIYIWDINTGNIILRTKEIESDIQCLDFSPNSDYIAIGTANGAIIVWSLKTGKQLLSLYNKNRAWNYSVDFSSDGNYLLSSHDYRGKGQICLWDVNERELIISMTPHASIAYAMFSPDDRHFLTYSWDGTARIFSSTPIQSKINRFHFDPLVDWSLTLWEKDRYFLQ